MGKTARSTQCHSKRDGIETRVARWLELCQDLINKDFADSILTTPQLRIVGGRRYLSVRRFDDWNCDAYIASGRPPKEDWYQWAFIDVTNGNILKPKTYKTPAPKARGNIFDDDYGIGRMTIYGPEYLK
jgi:hypothetical protein